MRNVVSLLLFVGCSAGAEALPPDAAAPHSDAPAPTDTAPLEIHALGVQGFVLKHGPDIIMTAPLYTRQSAIEVGLDLPLASDTDAIDAGLASESLADVRAILSGHAHYDHFIDVPHILTKAPNAIAYTNLTGRHMLAALAPDRPACSNEQPTPVIARSRVIAVDDPLASYVDYTNCPELRPEGAPLEGRWVDIPDSQVRLYAVCSMHPAQVGPYHFGEGSIDADQCDLPTTASGWKEGLTVGFVIDFLDTANRPAFRVFYQDAPTNAPIGFVPDAILAEKPVDVAVLCVGSSDNVEDYPASILGNVKPRYALNGHWEDFFQSLGSTVQPIPLLDVDAYLSRADSVMSGPVEQPLVIDGETQSTRDVLVQPGAHYTVPRAP